MPAIALTLLFCFATAAKAADKPNFILIFVDDLGYADIGPFGSELHRTPHLDKMAQEGRKLTSFYVTAPVCTPSRGSLMTGSYPRRIGLDESEKGQWVLFPGNREGLSPDEITLAEVLQRAGYETACVGKWHLGDQREFLPTRHGFDSYFGIPFSNDMGHDSRPQPYRYPPLPLLRGEEVVEEEPDQRLITKRYTEEALAFIERDRQGRPFFLYLPHTMPHWPQYASERFAGKSENGAWGDAVEEIDWSTGRILAKLEELGIDDDTLVVFTSDNGGAVQHGASNFPLRGGKGTTWEGGHRVPFLARWPGRVPAGTASGELAISVDILPTFAALAGADVPSDRVIDGKDIRPLLLSDRAEPTPHVAYFYYFMSHLNGVRSGRWKLHVARKGGRYPDYEPNPVLELYDLHADIAERHNVADRFPQVVARLQALAALARADLGDGKRAGRNQRPPGMVDVSVTLTAN
ncbi:MAG: sulfatase [Bryobacterales bacterium]|nr:sulfatase [Bryobacterales bacterium]